MSAEARGELLQGGEKERLSSRQAEGRVAIEN